MADTMVQVSEIRDWANRIFDAIEGREICSVDLSGRHYWMLESTEIWGAAPPEAVVGDLADDVADIRSDMTQYSEQVRAVDFAAWHTLDHLIGVLGKLSADLKGHRFASEATS